MNKIKTIISAAVLSLSTNAFAFNTEFSPYADLTINTHWDSRYQDMEPMDLVAIASSQQLNSFHLAFVTDSGLCEPAWGGQSMYTLKEQWGRHLTDVLHNNKVNIAVSFGGASGTDLSKNCEISQLEEVFQQTLSIYHAKTLDFDLENGTADVDKLMTSLKLFQQKFPTIETSFTLPVMPEGLTYAGKQILNAAKSAGIHFKVNIMAMDYGPAYNGDMGDYAINAATAVYNELADFYPEVDSNKLWSLIKVTPMIGVNDVNTEQFTLQNADKLKQFADLKQLGGLSMWSVARDKPCADPWASPICSGNQLQQADYQFTQHLR